jgi:hypothetical protein
MTTPNPTISPMAQRFIASGHAARPRADHTLGDSVAADRRPGRCIKCGAKATHRALGNPAYIVCKAHSDRWDVPIA